MLGTREEISIIQRESLKIFIQKYPSMISTILLEDKLEVERC